MAAADVAIREAQPGAKLATGCAPARFRPVETSLACTWSVPKPVLARPAGTRKTARKGVPISWI